jgi:fumarate reductase subunit C
VISIWVWTIMCQVSQILWKDCTFKLIFYIREQITIPVMYYELYISIITECKY